MSHSYQRIWIHAIWSTKNRLPLIKSDIENELYSFLYKEYKECGCPIHLINGMPEHIHCLFLLNPKKSISEIIKQIKGSSSHYINQQNLTNAKFAWQNGYSAFSVSESLLDKVYNYIKKQKLHHQKKSFQEEYEAFLKLHSIEINKI
jgi:REP element-mobilizing transposase RayT